MLVSGFALGSFYALIALGFSLIFGITHAFNLAHGELIVLSGYLAYAFWSFFQVPPLATLPLCLLIMPLVALLLQNLLRHVREPYELNTLVVTFGLALLLQNAMLAVFSADYRLIQTASVTSWRFPTLNFTITENQLKLLGLSLLATGLLHVLMRKTFLGKALRATIQDREAAQLAGINIKHMAGIAFILGGLLIGLAGPLFAQNMYLYPAGGAEATLIAIMITIFAGIGRTRAILAGGWLLGLAESWATLTLGGSWRELISSVLLIALLYFKPRGILTRSEG
jgi:branched-chain amino acid transport system permease protein